MSVMSKEINFYRRWLERPEKRERSARRLRAAAPYLALAVVGAFVYSVFLVGNHNLQTQIDALDAWCTDEKNVEQVGLSLMKQGVNQVLRADIAAVEALTDARDSYPVVHSPVVQRITDAGGASIAVRMDSYDAATGVLNFTARSPQVIDIPNYIRALEDPGLFYVVDYTGYGLEPVSNLYAIHVTCSLDAEAGREG